MELKRVSFGSERGRRNAPTATLLATEELITVSPCFAQDSAHVVGIIDAQHLGDFLEARERAPCVIITAKVYSHVLPTDDARAVAAWESTVQGPIQ